MAFEIFNSPFDDGMRAVYKNGVYVGYIKDGKPYTRKNVHFGGCDMTRAKGYRYWKKHFPTRALWTLPMELITAIELEPWTRGEYTDAKTGEVIAYEG